MLNFYGAQKLIQCLIEWQCPPFFCFSVVWTWPKCSLPNEEMESCGLYFWCTVALFAFALLQVPLRTCTSASPRSGQHLQVHPLLGKVLWILRKGWGGVRKQEELFVVLLLDHPFCTILVDTVDVVQRCAQHSVWARHAHFPWRLQPHGWGYLRLVLSARGASGGRENCPWCTAMAKPPMILSWWVWDMSLRKRLSPSPMLWQYSE